MFLDYFKVYIIRGTTTGLLKFGRTTNMEERFKAIQSCSPDILEIVEVLPFPSLEDSAQFEAAIHEALADSHSHGEWFHPTEHVLEIVDRLKAYKPQAIEECNIDLPWAKKKQNG